MLKQIRTNLLVLSILFIALGVCLLVYPAQSQQILCYIIGGAIAVYGVWGLLHYLITRPAGIYAQFSMVFSIVCIGFGAFLLLKPEIIISVLPFVFGLFIAFDGLVRFPTAVQLCKAGYNLWWSYLLLALVSIGLGAFMIVHPFATAVLMFQALGVVLIVEGALNMFATLYASMQLNIVRKAVDEVLKDQPARLGPDVVAEAEATEVPTPEAPADPAPEPEPAPEPTPETDDLPQQDKPDLGL